MPGIEGLKGWRLWVKLLVLALLIVAAAIAGRDLVHHLRALEDWTLSHGWLGPVAFILLVVVFASVFVPETLFAVTAGVLFGVVGGSLVMIVATLLTAVVNFVFARSFLREMVSKALLHRPRLAAIQQAVRSEGVRFQFLLRLTPINPVAVNYVLGASESRFLTFIAACAGLIPGLVVEVYFGHTARHAALAGGGVSDHSNLHAALNLTGLLLCVVVLLYMTRIARKALSGYQPLQTKSDNRVDTGTKT